jgi:hypothetical protein
MLTPSANARDMRRMAEEGFLIGVSQLGATFAGFVAIFLIFVRQDGRFSPADALRIRALIYTSLLVVVVGLIPLALNFLVEASQLWRASGAAALAVGTPVIIDVARSHLAMKVEDRREIVMAHAVVTYGLAIASAALVAALALGFGDSGLYVLALLLTLISVAVTFLTLSFKNLF